jgi:hypothetical protein
MLNRIRADFYNKFPKEVVDALIDSYIEIKENYYLGRHEPAELNGGKFTEATVRLLQYILNGGRYDPLEKHIQNMSNTLRSFEQTPHDKFHDSYRIHIPRILSVIYDIRNKRGVGHLSGDVNPNIADATLIATCCDWVFAELYRINYGCSINEAQKIIETLVQRKNPLIYQIGDTKRVLNPKLDMTKQTLLLLGECYPNEVSEKDLIKWIEPSNASGFRRDVLRRLHEKRTIEYVEKTSCIILPPGLKIVEENYSKWMNSGNENGRH